ncbi:MAG TPA: helix-turn-helix transcriptional regulator [Acidimicrobiales bacterium]|nr:helix-turn-helix transcriptional regulator [Acidimicrobiales bacterium]
MKELPERFNELGSFIREQRGSARLSLRRLSELAGISNPYLSQIERGLRRPSAEILQQIAKALRISAETLYVQAGILEKPDGNTDLARHIFGDNNLNEEQKQALMRIYLSFRHENEDNADMAAASSAASSSPSSPGVGSPAADASVAGSVEASGSGGPSESPAGAEEVADRGSAAN